MSELDKRIVKLHDIIAEEFPNELDAKIKDGQLVVALAQGEALQPVKAESAGKTSG